MIRVVVPEGNNNITVSTPADSKNQVTTVNSIVFSEDLAKQWATKLDGKVVNEDFSSKYYATKSKEYSESVQGYKEEIENEVIAEINTQKNIALDTINSEVQSLKNGIITEAVESTQEQVALATEQANIAIAQTELVASTANKALEDIETLTTNSEQALETLSATSKQEIEALSNTIKTDANDIINTTRLKMGMTIVVDKVLSYEESQGLALQGTYVYKTAVAGERYGYPDFYKQYVEHYKNSSNITIEKYVGSNVTNVGAITNNQGVISGFSTSVYATVPNTLPTSTNLEIVAKVKLTEYASEHGVVYHSSVDTPVGFDNTGKLGLWNTSSWQHGSTVYELNRYIWVKTVWNGNSVRVYGMYDNNYNPDNLPNNWTLETTWNTTTNRFSGYTLELGFNSKATAQYLRGVIDLNGTFINSNGSRWWTGTTYSRLDYKQNSNGLKFYPISQKTTFDEIFNSTGVADFYGVDEANERIFLPRNKYFAVTGGVKGNGMTLGLTNGAVNYGLASSDFAKFGGATNQYGQPVGIAQNGNWQPTNGAGYGITTDPTKSGITLEPNENKYLYYVVGNTISDTSWIDVVTQVQGGVKDLEDKTQEGIERLKASSNALTTTQITNCITEIPQDIKLELKDGTLTLKAGSKVYVPNGFEADGTTPTFSEVIINSDRSIKQNYDSNGMFFIVYIKPNGAQLIGTGYKGSTLTNRPTSVGDYKLHYITSENKIFWDAPGEEDALFSLPIAIVNRSATVGYTSIEQTFNGFGYIGSTVFVLPNVKGLIPNGRNADGSLNNIEAVTKEVTIRTSTNAYNFDLALYPNGLVNTTNASNSLKDEENNYYYTGSTRLQSMSMGTGSFTASGVSSFNPKLPFRAVDYSDKPEVVSWSIPDYTKGINQSIDTTYTADHDGYITFCNTSGYDDTRYTLTLIYNGVTNSWQFGHSSNAMDNGCAWINYPVPKGSQYKITKDGGGSAYRMIFFPMKGAN